MNLKQKLRDWRAFLAECCRQSLEAPLYEAGIRTYALGARVAGLRNPKARKMVAGQRDTWSRLRQAVGHDQRWIWIHAASLGEFEQGRPIIERIKAERPELKVLLTFFSPSGFEVRKDYPLADCVAYLPFDTARNAERFVATVRPEMAIFVKYEIWRNYLRALGRHSVPTYLVSALFRPDQAFFRRSGAWYRAWLRRFTHIYVQTVESRKLLEGVGFGNVTVAGDTRFDRVAQICRSRKPVPEAEAFAQGASMVFIAGSSWESDEDVYLDFVNAHIDEVKAIIAPHEYDDRRLARLRERFAGKTLLLSEARRDPSQLADARVLIIDCFGLLSSLYAYADVAYVGGAFGAGLHNINEAAVYGIPVIFGPNYHKFAEAEDLIFLGGAESINSPSFCTRRLSEWLYNPSQRKRQGEIAANYIAEKQGATDIIFRDLFA